MLRLYYTRKFVEATDETYWQSFLGAWLYLEVAVGIIVGCMPAFPKYVQHIKNLRKKNPAAGTQRLDSGLPHRATKSRSSKDPYDVHRYLNESHLQLEDHSAIELDAFKSRSPSTHESFV